MCAVNGLTVLASIFITCHYTFKESDQGSQAYSPFPELDMWTAQRDSDGSVKFLLWSPVKGQTKVTCEAQAKLLLLQWQSEGVYFSTATLLCFLRKDGASPTSLSPCLPATCRAFFNMSKGFRDSIRGSVVLAWHVPENAA